MMIMQNDNRDLRVGNLTEVRLYFLHTAVHPKQSKAIAPADAICIWAATSPQRPSVARSQRDRRTAGLLAPVARESRRPVHVQCGPTSVVSAPLRLGWRCDQVCSHGNFRRIHELTHNIHSGHELPFMELDSKVRIILSLHPKPDISRCLTDQSDAVVCR